MLDDCLSVVVGAPPPGVTGPGPLNSTPIPPKTQTKSNTACWWTSPPSPPSSWRWSRAAPPPAPLTQPTTTAAMTTAMTMARRTPRSPKPRSSAHGASSVGSCRAVKERPIPPCSYTHPGLTVHFTPSPPISHLHPHPSRLDTTQSPLAVLSVVEATPFKELTHLALRLRPATDAALKVTNDLTSQRRLPSITSFPPTP